MCHVPRTISRVTIDKMGSFWKRNRICIVDEIGIVVKLLDQSAQHVAALHRADRSTYSMGEIVACCLNRPIELGPAGESRICLWIYPITNDPLGGCVVVKLIQCISLVLLPHAIHGISYGAEFVGHFLGSHSRRKVWVYIWEELKVVSIV